jgi:hypothetical protein
MYIQLYSQYVKGRNHLEELGIGRIKKTNLVRIICEDVE